MEVSGLNAELIDVAVYTQQALEAAARIAEVLNDTDAKDRYRKLAADLKDKINQKFWIERDGTYADFYGSRSQAISAAEGAIKQIGLQGADKLTQKDKDLIADYRRLKAQFAAMPEGDRAGSPTRTGSSQRQWKPESLRPSARSRFSTRSGARTAANTARTSLPSRDRR
jgi:neutral trehalase